MSTGVKKNIFIALFFLSLSPYSIAIADEIEILSFKFSLSNCELNYEIDGVKKSKKLVFNDYCKFHTNRSGEPRVEFVHEKYVILIERSIPHPKSEIDRFFQGKCDTRLLGVIIDENKITISKNVVKVLGCAGLNWDRKVFSSFAKKN